MTRKAHLEPYLSSQDLKARYRATVDKVERCRWHLLWLVSAQWTIKAAAAAVGLSYDYALEIVKNYNSGGIEALKNRHRGRKPSRKKNALLDQVQLAQLKECLLHPHPDKRIWTGPKVAQWIATRTGREKVWPQRGWDYLKKWHYSLKVPRPRHQKGDKEQQEQFKQLLPQRFKELQQKYPTAKIEVWSFDEHRLGPEAERLRLRSNQFYGECGHPLVQGQLPLSIIVMSGCIFTVMCILPPDKLSGLSSPVSTCSGSI